MINISSKNNKNIYKVVGSKYSPEGSAITVMTKDKLGRLWTASEDGKVIMWDRLTFFKHLINESCYREEDVEIINRQGER